MEQQADYKARKQTIFRTVKNQDHPFVMIDRRPIENPALSWKAKGVLAYLLSRPDNWIVRIGDLVKRSPDGVYAIRGAINELVKEGHIHRKEVRDPQNGQFLRYELEVYELPFRTSPVSNLPQADNPQAGNLTLNDIDSNDTDSNGANALVPLENMPIDWQIGNSVTKIVSLTEEQQFEREARDRANLIEFQCAGAGALAYAFMMERRVLLPESSVKGQRKAAREMLEAKVTPEHVTEATRQLKTKKDKNGNPLTVVDLFGIKKTAISIANAVQDFVVQLDGSALEKYA